MCIRTTNPIERLNKEFKRRTKAMEVTGGEESTYRIMVYVAQNMDYSWSFNKISNCGYRYHKLVNDYTQNAA